MLLCTIRFKGYVSNNQLVPWIPILAYKNFVIAYREGNSAHKYMRTQGGRSQYIDT